MVNSGLSSVPDSCATDAVLYNFLLPSIRTMSLRCTNDVLTSLNTTWSVINLIITEDGEKLVKVYPLLAMLLAILSNLFMMYLITLTGS